MVTKGMKARKLSSEKTKAKNKDNFINTHNGFRLISNLAFTLVLFHQWMCLLRVSHRTGGD